MYLINLSSHLLYIYIMYLINLSSTYFVDRHKSSYYLSTDYCTALCIVYDLRLQL